MGRRRTQHVDHPRGRASAIGAACVVAFALAASGCASRSGAWDGAATPPDFTLSVTVGPDAPGFVGARYIVEPGGAFRAAIGDGATPDLSPPFSRRLSRDETDALWRAAAALQHPARVGDEKGLFESGAAVVVFVRAGESTRVYAPDATRDVASAALLEQLEALAWVR